MWACCMLTMSHQRRPSEKGSNPLRDGEGVMWISHSYLLYLRHNCFISYLIWCSASIARAVIDRRVDSFLFVASWSWCKRELFSPWPIVNQTFYEPWNPTNIHIFLNKFYLARSQQESSLELPWLRSEFKQRLAEIWILNFANDEGTSISQADNYYRVLSRVPYRFL